MNTKGVTPLAKEKFVLDEESAPPPAPPGLGKGGVSAYLF